ncbi:truncated protein ORF151A [Cyprinid herpesvirus 2]|uniref:Truncated protein ORF151A n=1 Tax=Cyprinid herpesvirus 2 TaxID=317878 RepID=K7PCP7_CYHV2|nr:truncated protein ORF151A [Cyprinid herpesvirus 2]AFJ20575.1 truncated protein ORF151A [Cyprinid herpesvirus 2]
MLIIAVILLTLSGLDAVRLIPTTRRAITKPTIKKSLDELFVIATNDSEWLETDRIDPRVCPNKFGFYGTLLDGSFVIKCDYHVQMINMKYENNTDQIMHIYDYKWPVHFNRSDYRGHRTDM